MSKHGFGRTPSPKDERDFKMAAAVHVLEALPRPEKTWHSDLVLNQGSTPHCVGFSWAGWGISTPVEDKWSNAEGHSIYAACKVLDGEPGEENGSSVRIGAKVMKQRSRIGTYFFASDVEEAADYVARFGPVVLGTDWYEGMSDPIHASGVMRPTGEVVGGHAYLWIGVTAAYAIIRNSWGVDWGVAGESRIKLTDLQKVFSNQGEAAAATETPLNISGVAQMLSKFDKLR
jgi:hypothetical protein